MEMDRSCGTDLSTKWEKEARAAEGDMDENSGKRTRWDEIMGHSYSLGQEQGQVEATHFWPGRTWGKGTKQNKHFQNHSLYAVSRGGFTGCDSIILLGAEAMYKWCSRDLSNLSEIGPNSNWLFFFQGCAGKQLYLHPEGHVFWIGQIKIFVSFNACLFPEFQPSFNLFRVKST